MDLELEEKLNRTVQQLQELSDENIDLSQMDPIAKMMLVALIHEEQEIIDYIDGIDQKMIERYCAEFIPYEKIQAVPAIAVIQPTFKKDTGIVSLGTGTFSFKKKEWKKPLNYIPIFDTQALPFSKLYFITQNHLSAFNDKFEKEGEWEISMEKPNHLWVGITTKAEVESLKGLSLMLDGTNGIYPEHIYVGNEHRELDFASMREMENIEMVPPFDAQQASNQFFSFISNWKDSLLHMENASLIYITDPVEDRDLFKRRPFPKMFQRWLEEETLDCFEENTLWLQLVFPEKYPVPASCEIILNTMPVVNVDVCDLMLTQSSPIAKLQKHENSFFLRILETTTTAQKQGFSATSDEIIIRDFDANVYHDGDLYRDIRNLYNKFSDNYFAYMEYNGIKDSKDLRLLRELINKLGKSVDTENEKDKFDSGTYVMRTMNQLEQTSATKVKYITTQGRIGNTPVAGDMMENKRLPAIEQKVLVYIGAMGGADKATPDERFEQLRYYALTNDRLYTRMDVDAFLRKEIMAEFGKTEFLRIFIKINVEGAGGPTSLRRGLYIDLEFKDKKNYDHAVDMSFDTLMQQKIENHSCIAMPIIVTLKNLEE